MYYTRVNTVHVLICEGNISEFTFERSFYIFVSDQYSFKIKGIFTSVKVTARLVEVCGGSLSSVCVGHATGSPSLQFVLTVRFIHI